MPKPGEPFSAADLAELFSVSDEVPEVWWANGEGPDYFEQSTAEGVKRFCTAEAVKAFVDKHRVLRPAPKPSPLTALRAGPRILGGALFPRVKA